MGRDKVPFDKKKVMIPNSDKEKPVDCECGLSDFKQILHKQVKFSNRNSKVLKKVQERRQVIFQDKLVHSPDDLIK